MTAQPRGKYWEDFSEGEVIRTPRRTVTTTDIVNFACLSGDFNEVHTNWEYLKETKFDQPLAHGPLVYSIAAGLQYASGINDGTLIALLQIDGWRMLLPVFNGDTIHAQLTVLSKNETSKPDKGVVQIKREFVNQRGEVVQEMVCKMLYKRRPAA